MALTEQSTTMCQAVLWSQFRDGGQVRHVRGKALR